MPINKCEGQNDESAGTGSSPVDVSAKNHPAVLPMCFRTYTTLNVKYVSDVQNERVVCEKVSKYVQISRSGNGKRQSDGAGGVLLPCEHSQV